MVIKAPNSEYCIRTPPPAYGFVTETPSEQQEEDLTGSR